MSFMLCLAEVGRALSPGSPNKVLWPQVLESLRMSARHKLSGACRAPQAAQQVDCCSTC